jgi:hypothetical protein
MPGLVPGIHVFFWVLQVVDGRDKPGHDEDWNDGESIARQRSHRIPVDSSSLLIRLRTRLELKEFDANPALVALRQT